MSKSNTRKKQKSEKKKSGSGSIAQYPKKLLSPISNFLQKQVKFLEKRKKDVEKEDPFNDSSRISDNASPDTDAAEQFGHARTSAIREQIDRKIIQSKKALARVRVGKYGICEDCKDFIDTDRLMIYPEATLCPKCQSKREK